MKDDRSRGTSSNIYDYMPRKTKNNQFRKDGKNIGDLLSYKDYALEDTKKGNFKSTKNQFLQ